MLSSIHPFGERTRHNTWAVTAVSFIVGAIIGGTALGALAGTVGWVAHQFVAWSATAAFAVAAVAVTLATLGDVVRGSRALPWPERQVNEDWLTTYRGWVYGIGFGFQLGGGLLTYVTTMGVLAMIAVAILTASAVVGGVIGAVFGLFRGLAVLTTSGVRDPQTLRSFHRTMSRLAKPVRRSGLVAQCAVVIIAVIAVAVV
ncbi:MAG: hypothetical protein M3132_10935 [Actinomycetia bacterium]|nr:hypothetical protein [Actinomycetes bacterium]